MKCLCAHTRRAARLLTQRYEEALRPAGLTPAQFEILGELSRHDTIAQADLAKALAVDQTTLSRSLKLLLAQGWIENRPGYKDRRQTTYTLAPAGRHVWQAALPLWQAVHNQMHDALGSAWTSTWSALDLLNDTIQQ